MPIDQLDPRTLLLGLQPQARTPYDAQDLVAERRARVEQLREAAKAKQDAEYENQLYDWAVKSNLGPDGTPDFEGVRKSLAATAPRYLQKFDAAMNTAKKSTLETQKLQDDHRAALTGWAGSAFNNADETNYGDIFPVVQKGAPELVKQYGLTGDYQHDKGAIGAVRSAATSMPEQLKAAEEARGHVLKNEWDLAAAKKLDALATSGQLTDDTLVSGLNELRDVGMPTSVYQRWNIPLEKAAALAKNIQITPEQRVQAQQAQDTLDETKREHDLLEQSREDAAKRAEDAAKATAAYRAEMVKQGYARLGQGQQRLDKTKTGPDVGDVSSDVRTTMSGKTYVDLGDYETPTMRQAARDAAKKSGLTVVDKATGDSLRAADTAKLNTQAMWSQIQSKLPKDAQGRVTAGPTNKLSQFFQTDADLAAFNSWRAGAIQAVQALVERGMGFRLNQAEINMIMQNDMPQITDTYATAQTRVNNVLKLLQNKEDAALTRDRSALGPTKGTYSVSSGGKTYTFTSQADLDKFKQEAGIK